MAWPKVATCLLGKSKGAIIPCMEEGAQSLNRRIPMYSLKGESPEDTASLRMLPYLNELKRQAEICSDSILRAWQLAIRGTKEADPEVWATLQAALFAAIIVQRTLKPSGVRKYSHHQKREQSQKEANKRGNALRKLLGISDDSYLFEVSKVRHPFEHVDERLDQLMRPKAVSVSDWYISDGRILATPLGKSAGGGFGLRAFFPEGGVLVFDGKELDLYKLDHCMIDLCIGVDKVLDETRIKGRASFGGGQLIALMEEQEAQVRLEAWISGRKSRGKNLQ